MDPTCTGWDVPPLLCYLCIMEMLSDLIRISQLQFFFENFRNCGWADGCFPYISAGIFSSLFPPRKPLLSPLSLLQQHKAQHNTEHTKSLGTPGYYVRRLEPYCHPFRGVTIARASPSPSAPSFPSFHTVLKTPRLQVQPRAQAAHRATINDDPKQKWVLEG